MGGLGGPVKSSAPSRFVCVLPPQRRKLRLRAAVSKCGPSEGRAGMLVLRPESACWTGRGRPAGGADGRGFAAHWPRGMTCWRRAMSKVREGPRERSRDREGGRDGETGREWAPCSEAAEPCRDCWGLRAVGIRAGSSGGRASCGATGRLGFCPSL